MASSQPQQSAGNEVTQRQLTDAVLEMRQRPELAGIDSAFIDLLIYLGVRKIPADGASANIAARLEYAMDILEDERKKCVQRVSTCAKELIEIVSPKPPFGQLREEVLKWVSRFSERILSDCSPETHQQVIQAQDLAKNILEKLDSIAIIDIQMQAIQDTHSRVLEILSSSLETQVRNALRG